MMTRFRALDGAHFELDSALTLAESSTTSGAWCDGPAGFIQLFSGPQSELDGWKRISQFRERDSTKVADGTLSVGTIQREGPDLVELTVGAWAGRRFAVWGYNNQTVGSVMDYFRSFTFAEFDNGISIETDSRWSEIVSGPSPVFATAQDRYIAAFEARSAINAREKPRNRGQALEAGELYRSDRDDDPSLYLFNESASVEVLPIVEDQPADMDALVAGIASAQSLRHEPVI